MGSDLDRVLDEAVRQGWRVERGRGGYWKCWPPDKAKPMVVVSGTPSDQGAIRKIIRDLVRSGLRWPPEQKGAR